MLKSAYEQSYKNRSFKEIKLSRRRNAPSTSVGGTYIKQKLLAADKRLVFKIQSGLPTTRASKQAAFQFATTLAYSAVLFIVGFLPFPDRDSLL